MAASHFFIFILCVKILQFPQLFQGEQLARVTLSRGLRGEVLEQRDPGGEAAGTGVLLYPGLLRLTDGPIDVLSATTGWARGGLGGSAVS